MTGGIALSQSETLADECDDNVCSSRNVYDAKSSANNLALTTDILLPVGGSLAAAGLVTSYGVRVDSTFAPEHTAVIERNTLDGGESGSTYGFSSVNADPLVQYNTIHGGLASSSYSRGIATINAQGVFRFNVIDGGHSASNSSGNSAGVVVAQGGEALFDGNTVSAGQGDAGAAYGIIVAQGGQAHFFNNVVTGGTAVTTYGAYAVDGGSSLSLMNNTIHDYKQGITVSSTPTMQVHNNILTTSMSSAVAISGSAGTPTNNLFAGWSSGTTSSDGNVILTNTTAVGFEAYGSGDFHLTCSSPVNVRQGGRDGADEGWGFDEDKDSNTRTDLTAGPDDGPTNTNAAGWSMGAYENDLNCS